MSLDLLHGLLLLALIIQSVRFWHRGQSLESEMRSHKAVCEENAQLRTIKERFESRQARAKSLGLQEWESVGGPRDWGIQVERKNDSVSRVTIVIEKPLEFS